MRYGVAAGISIVGFLISQFITSRILPDFLNLCIPTIFALLSIGYLRRSQKGIKYKPYLPVNERRETQASPNDNQVQNQASNQVYDQNERAQEENDPFWGPVIQYIHVLEEMIISEGQKNTLDDEIVEKTLKVLTRVLRLIPQLKKMNDPNINHNIQRLVFKDINGAVNPFLNLGPEAKRQNRRLLLNGMKDINSKLSQYVESIEQKDLIELKTRMDLIQQRYSASN
ncbi:hypothetical protein ACE41H_16995 [Paenibacillus enshidis]|uniref:5-bromo-4-chloroindolyl phosphate hydrolysis protein n=1 Tax=Paenibacillus enshidis TaxID=1458439 RepID=A0ABV5AW69_9BACL